MRKAKTMLSTAGMLVSLFALTVPTVQADSNSTPEWVQKLHFLQQEVDPNVMGLRQAKVINALNTTYDTTADSTGLDEVHGDMSDSTGNKVPVPFFCVDSNENFVTSAITRWDTISGNFRGLIQPGTYSIHPVFTGDHLDSTQTITVDKPSTEVKIRLSNPTYMITGHIVDPNQKPLQGYGIMLTQDEGPYGIFLSTIAITDSNGNFIATGIPDGTYEWGILRNADIKDFWDNYIDYGQIVVKDGKLDLGTVSPPQQ